MQPFCGHCLGRAEEYRVGSWVGNCGMAYCSRYAWVSPNPLVALL